jgi:radical SAM superfamily enzyme YgiQ (UPF0313 family)
MNGRDTVSGNDLFGTSRTAADNFSDPDLILTQAPWWSIDTPSLTLARLTSHLRHQGFKVLPLDLNIECHSDHREKWRGSWSENEASWLWSTPAKVLEFIDDHIDVMNRFVDTVLSSNAKAVGFSIYSSSIHASIYLAQRIKRTNPEIKIIFGGPLCARYLCGAAFAALAFVDVVVMGEGELTLEDLMRCITSGQSIKNCAGTLYCEGGTVIDNGDRELLKDLNTLPFADFSDYNFSSYNHPNRLPMESSRGCINSCNFCNERPYWKRYRCFKGERLFAEVQHQLNAHPHIDYIFFHDSLINGRIREIERFAELVIENKLKFRWWGMAVIRKEMTYALMKKLKDAGCETLTFGLESASCDLLLKTGKHMVKNADFDQIACDAHRSGIQCTYNFMFGLPGETEAQAEETLDFLRRNKDYLHQLNPAYEFCSLWPGSQAYDNPDKFQVCHVESNRYWQSEDGSNNFLERLRRFENFVKLSGDLGIKSLYPYHEMYDRDKNIGNYYFYRGDYENAVIYYRNWLEKSTANHIDDTHLQQCLEKLGSAGAIKRKIS